jgi:hypothetical protein
MSIVFATLTGALLLLAGVACWTVDHLGRSADVVLPAFMLLCAILARHAWLGGLDASARRWIAGFEDFRARLAR